MKILAVVLMSFLVGCAGTATMTTTGPDGTVTTIKGKTHLIQQQLALDAQVQTAAIKKEVDLEKIAARGCPTVSEEVVALMSPGGQQAYWNAQNKCMDNMPLMAARDMADEAFEEIRLAAGQPSDYTAIGVAYAKEAINFENKKAERWGKIVGGVTIASGFYFGSQAITALSAAAGAGGARILAAPGSRVTYTSADPSSSSSGINANVFSDSANTPEGTTTPGGSSSSTNSASGDNNGAITITNSPIIWGDKFNYQTLDPFSNLTQDKGTLQIDNNSNDENIIGPIPVLPEPGELDTT